MPSGVFPSARKASANIRRPSQDRQRLFYFLGKVSKEGKMQPDDEKFLRLSKEIIIKFIELGRVSPGNFEENFKSVFWTLKRTVVDAQVPRIDTNALQTDDSDES
jgi:hypothetical protein